MYHIGQKLRMLENYDGKGKDRIVYVAKLQDNGTPLIVETKENWGWRRDDRAPTDYICRGSNCYWNVKNYEGRFEIIEDFKIGNKVKLLRGYKKGCADGFLEKTKIGDIGVVCEKCKYNEEYGVNFGRDVDGHNCGSRCPDKFGQYILSENLKLVTDTSLACSSSYSAPDELGYYILPEYFGLITRATCSNSYSVPIVKKIGTDKKEKIMSVIKNLFKTTERKALEYFSIINGDGGLTNTGKEEFIDFLYEKMTEERKEFIKKIVEAYKEEKKK